MGFLKHHPAAFNIQQKEQSRKNQPALEAARESATQNTGAKYCEWSSLPGDTHEGTGRQPHRCCVGSLQTPDLGCCAHGRDCSAGCGLPGKNFTGRLIDVGRYLSQFTVCALTACKSMPAYEISPSSVCEQKLRNHPHFSPSSSSWFLNPPSASVMEIQTQFLLVQHSL